MNTDWIDFKCKSGQTLFIYNKVTGEHRWPDGDYIGSSENSVMNGHPVVVKEFHTMSTQTDDYGCDNGCLSIYATKDLCDGLEISETSPQLQPGIDEHSLDNERVPEDTLEDGDEQEQSVNMDEIFLMMRVKEESNFPSENNSAEKSSVLLVDSVDDGSVEKKVEKQLHTTKKSTNLKSFKCSHCEKTFAYKHTLKRHLRAHSGEKPFECSYCEKKFARRYTLKIHLRTHSGEKPFECSYCEKKFAQRFNLKTHLLAHSGEKPFGCTYCEKKFAQKHYLKIHFLVHSGERPFECSYCGKKFAQKNNLKTHLRTHSGEKPFECSCCRKKFADSSTLKNHLRTHSGEKPSECSYC